MFNTIKLLLKSVVISSVLILVSTSSHAILGKCSIDEGYSLPYNTRVDFYECYHHGFAEGLVVVIEGEAFGTNNKYGFATKQGEVIIPLDYDDAVSFQEGFALVEQQGKFGFVNPKGEYLVPIEYDSANSFSDGLAVVEKAGKYGYINKQGEVAIPLIYDKAYFFKQGMALVGVNEKLGLINLQGQLIIPIEYDDAYPAASGDDSIALKKGDKWGYVDRTGQIIIPFIYDEAHPFNERYNGLARVGKDGEIFYINKQNEKNSKLYNLVKKYQHYIWALILKLFAFIILIILIMKIDKMWTKLKS